MIACVARGDGEPACQAPAQDVGQLLMTAILGEGQQRFLEGIAAVCRIGTVVQEKRGDVALSFTRREVDWRRVVVLDGRERGMARHEFLHRGDVTLARRGEHGEDIVRWQVRSIGERPTPTGRELHRTNERPQNEPAAGDGLHMVHQLRPTRETELARDRELRVGEGDPCAATDGRHTRARVSAARVVKQVLGLLAELLERRALGEGPRRSGRAAIATA